MQQQSKQSGSGVLEILLALVIVGAIIIAGLLIYQRQKTMVKSVTMTQQTTTAQQPTTSTDPYAGWKSAALADEKLGFRYPANWALSTAPDVDNSFTHTAENIEVRSPVTDGHYLGVSLQAGPASTTLGLNWLGTSNGITIKKLEVPGAPQQLYLDAEANPDKDHISCLALATTPGDANHTTAFGILDNGGKGQHNIVMYACLTPDTPTPTDNGAEYSLQKYTTNPYYQTVIKIFQSLYYPTQNIAINEWDVKAPYIGGLDLTYAMSADDKSATFSSNQLTALSSDCAGRGGEIIRYAATDQLPDGQTVAQAFAGKDPSTLPYAHIGNYYYTFAHDQAACGDLTSTAAVQSQTNDAVRSLLAHLQTAG